MKRIIGLFLCTITSLAANPFGTDWLKFFGERYRSTYSLPRKKNTILNPLGKLVLSASSDIILNETEFSPRFSSFTGIPDVLTSFAVVKYKPELCEKIMTIFAPATKEKSILATAPIGIQRMAKLSKAEEKEHDSKLLQGTFSLAANVALSVILDSVKKDAEDRTPEALHLPLQLATNQTILYLSERFRKMVDHWFRPAQEEDVAKKLECHSCLHDLAGHVPSETTDEGAKWKRAHHLCSEDFERLANETSGCCEECSHR